MKKLIILNLALIILSLGLTAQTNPEQNTKEPTDAGKSFVCGNPLIDTRDGQSYATVQIGDQCWMAENLKYLPSVVGPGTGSNTVPYYYVYGYNGTDLNAAKATANYQTYGALYNWPASLNACPEGWHLPSDAEWTALTTYVSSQPEYLCNSNNTSWIAKSLAATTNWSTHTGTCTVGNNLNANNATNFTALPGGLRYTDGSFYSLSNNGTWWSSTEFSSSGAYFPDMNYYVASVGRGGVGKSAGFSVRCLKDETPPPTTYNLNLEVSPTGAGIVTGAGQFEAGEQVNITAEANPGWEFVNWTDEDDTEVSAAPNFVYPMPAEDVTLTANFQEEQIGFTCGLSNITDVDGNIYNTVLIGNQCWMKENLKTTKYRNGTPIEYPGVDNNAWQNNTTGAYAWYDNDISWKDSYGAYYNWHAVTKTTGLCPEGWHVPQLSEFTDLIDYLGGQSVAGGKLKSTSTEPDPHPRWLSPNTGATNESGFTAVPAGYRWVEGWFADFGSRNDIWTSSILYGEYPAHVTTWGGGTGVSTAPAEAGTGISIRCIKETSPPAEYNLNLDMNPAGVGVVTGAGQYEAGEQVNITAEANPGWEFVNWTDEDDTEVSAAPNFVYTMPVEDVTLTATFVEEQVGFTCGEDITFTYRGEVVTYGTIARGGICWMDRNLGADPMPLVPANDATGNTDTRFYGDLFQWGRLDDGHQDRQSGTTPGPINQDVPGHDDFITVNSSPWDWRSPQNNALWQGGDGINNPCPEGWRVPTEAELNAERQSWGSNNSDGAYASTLKWPVSGTRERAGTLGYVGSWGLVWSSSVSGFDARFLIFTSSNALMNSWYRTDGMSVRCVMDETTSAFLPTISTSPVVEIAANTATSGGNITNDGGVPVTARGVVWSSSTVLGFEEIDIEFISGFNLTGDNINGSNNEDNQLTPGTIVLYKTNENRFGKFRVLDYDYSLTLEWVTYNEDGSEFSSGDNLTINASWFCDLDLGIQTSTWSVVDFQWSLQTEEIRYLLPANGALFGIYNIDEQSVTIEGSEGFTVDGEGIGEFISQLTGLLPETTYLVRAYATNSEGTGYGEQLSFTTLEEVPDEGINIIRGGPPETIPLAIPIQITGVNANPYNSNLNQWTGSWQAPQAIYDQGEYVNNHDFWSNIEGNSNAGSTWYNSSPGNSYGILVVDLQQVRQVYNISVFQMFSDGKITHIALAGHPETGSSAPDAFDDNWSEFLPQSPIEAGTNYGDYVGDPTRFFVNTSTRYVKIMAYNDGSFGSPWYIELKGIKIYGDMPEPGLPTVSTTEVTDITFSSAVSGGNIISDGGNAITARGVVWSTTENPTIETNEGITYDGEGTGSWVSEITELAPATTYYVRAYATNSEGTAYGNQQSFTTVNPPDLELNAAGLRILSAAGLEINNPDPGETIFIEVTVYNTGGTATADDVLVQVFLDEAPDDLESYDVNNYTIAASSAFTGSIPAGGSTTLLLPWTTDEPERLVLLNAAAEFTANRAQSQANSQGASEPLPVVELSYDNNMAARSLLIGTPAPGDFTILVEATAPENMQSGISYTLYGTANYSWSNNPAVLGALTTVTVNGVNYTTRTSSPNGEWSVRLNGLPEGSYPASVTVYDGYLTGIANLTLEVSPGPPTIDLRIRQMGYVSGTYRIVGETGYALTGEPVVLKALVRNDGNTGTGPFDVAFIGPEGDTICVSVPVTLAAFSQVWVTATQPYTAVEGPQTMKAYADSDNVIEETNENNNDRSCILIGTDDLPDLRPFYYLHGQEFPWNYVSGLSFNPVHPLEYQPVTVNCDIYNSGTSALPDGATFEVSFKAGGEEFASNTIILDTDLVPGASIQTSAIWSGGSAGAVVFSFHADTENAIAELDEDNNNTSRTLVVYPLADSLRIIALGFSPMQPLPEAAVNLTATVRNFGGLPGGDGVPVEFFAGSTDPEDKIGETLLDADVAAFGGMRNVTFAWTAPATVGNYPIFAKINDDSFQRTLNVTNSPAPNLQVFSEDIIANPPYPEYGDTVSVQTNVRNTEGSTAVDFMVHFFEDVPSGGWVEVGSPVGVTSLEVGSQTTVDASADIIANRAAYSIKVVLVPNPEQGDADESDNQATSSFVLADAPVADAGEDTEAIVGQTITLDGTGSTNAITYAWTLTAWPEGSAASLSGANTAQPQITPDVQGTYTVRLIVSDGTVMSLPDFVNIYAVWFPELTTAEVTGVTATSATTGGNITSDGGSPVTARGVVWSTTQNPTIETNEGITSDGSGTGSWVSELVELTPGTAYFVRAYATNSAGTGYGEELSFTTSDAGTFNCGDPLIDTRDGQSYATVQIGDQCWMAENLNIGTRINGSSNQTNNGIIEKYCYNNSEAQCDTYGGLYQWNEMMDYTTTAGVQGICPDGWYLPVDEEWKQLEGEVDSQFGYPDPEWDAIGWRGFDAGKNLKSTTGWSSGGNGTNLNGFGAKPGGRRTAYGGFQYNGSNGNWWSSSEFDASNAWPRDLASSHDGAGRYYSFFSKTWGFSVRCLRDATPATTYNLILEAEPSGAGTVSGAGQYEAGEEVNVAATSNPGWEFVNWTDDDGIVSEAANFTYTMPADDVTLTANFVEEQIIELPTVQTAAIGEITQTTAQSGGNITNDGGSPVTARGVVWSTTQNPTVETNEGITYDGSGTGSWVSELVELTPETTYYVRAYATNNAGTGYGGEYSFTTLSDDCTPGWVPTSYNQFNMQVIGQIFLNGEPSDNPNHVLGAFVDGECRGIASPDPNLMGLVFLSVGSDLSSGETVEFMIWNADICEECPSGVSIVFENQQQIGSPGNPFPFECGQHELSLNFGAGYTWFSANIDPGSMMLNNLFESLDPCEEDRILGQHSFATYYMGQWVGSLNAINPAMMYKMQLCAQQNMIIQGQPVANNPITLGAGYTWLGYLPQESIAINDALANITPTPSEDNRLLSQHAFAVWYQGQWVGSLTHLQPGKGYISQLSSQSILQYPMAGAKGGLPPKKEITSPTGEQPLTNKQYSMMLLAQLELPDGSISLNDEDVVYAFAGNECRGMAIPRSEYSGAIFMSVGSDQPEGEEITFKAWLSEFGTLEKINETISFEALKKAGTMEQPVLLTLKGFTGTGEGHTEGVFIGEPFPNPFSETTEIPYRLNETARVKLTIYNSHGQTLRILTDVIKHPGAHKATIHREGLQTGVYFYRMEIFIDGEPVQKHGKIIISQ